MEVNYNVYKYFYDEKDSCDFVLPSDNAVARTAKPTNVFEKKCNIFIQREGNSLQNTLTSITLMNKRIATVTNIDLFKKRGNRK